MTQIRTIRRKKAEKPVATLGSSDLNIRLADRRRGGMVLVDYLFNLFAASPLEQFSRLCVLTVLDRVRKDKDLFPDDAPGSKRRISAPRILTMRAATQAPPFV